MEISFVNKRALKIFKNDECVSIGIPKNKLLLHLDSIGMRDIIETNNIFKDLSNNHNDFILNDFDYNENSGWLDNNLHFDGKKSYISNTFNQLNLFTISISFHIPPNGKFISSFPGINYIYTKDTSLMINISGGNIITINNCIKENTFCNLIITYEAGRLTVYINGIKKHSSIINDKGYNNDIILGKDISDTFGEFMLHSVQYYGCILNLDEISSLSKLEQSRYIVYYDKDLVLDCRGYNYLLNYGGFISIRDNSIHKNHLRCKDWYTHLPKSRAYTITGINSMCITGRSLLIDSFTIEIMFSKIKNQFAEEVFLLGKYKEKEYGIELLLNVKGLIIRLHNKDVDTFEYIYPLTYTNKRNHIAISYNKNNKELLLYSNSILVKKFDNIIYSTNPDDMTLQFVKKDGYFPFIGNINSIRIYKECIDQKCIQDNYNKDIEIYYQ